MDNITPSVDVERGPAVHGGARSPGPSHVQLPAGATKILSEGQDKPLDAPVKTEVTVLAEPSLTKPKVTITCTLIDGQWKIKAEPEHSADPIYRTEYKRLTLTLLGFIKAYWIRQRTTQRQGTKN